MKHMRSKMKRQMGLSTNKCHKVRPKTTIRSRFLATKDAADAWAKEHNFEKYEVVLAKKGTKFRVIAR